MRTKLRPLLLSFLLTSLAACQTTEEHLAAFHGLDKARLLGRMGQPDVKEPDERGGEIWIYQEKRVSNPVAKETETVAKNLEDGKTTTTTREKQVAVQSPVVRMYFKSFYIDARGIIYDTAHGSRYLQR